MYFDKLLGAARTQKLVKTFFACQRALRSRQKNIFFVHFQIFFSDFSLEITEKVWNEQKRLKNGWKKCFDQLLGARSTQKLVEIHNICGFSSIWNVFGIVHIVIFSLFSWDVLPRVVRLWLWQNGLWESKYIYFVWEWFWQISNLKTLFFYV